MTSGNDLHKLLIIFFGITKKPLVESLMEEIFYP